MKFRLTATLALLAVGQIAHAGDINMTNLTGAQSVFKSLSENLSSAISYKAVAPAEPLGLTGFDVGLEVTSTQIKDKAVWDQATGGNAPSVLLLPKLHAHKGLPFGIDVGAFLTKAPGSNISLAGAELRYAIIEGNVALPAVAVRGAYTKLSGVDKLDFNTKSLEVTVSKGFAMLTPYAGVGRVWATSTPDASLTGLSEVSITQAKAYAGLNVNFGLMNFALEADKTGKVASYSMKVGLRF